MAENNRVLNHSEFAAKYNQQTEQDIAASYSEFSHASDNFQDGFDDSTYEEGQAGPKRPLAQGADATPDSPNGMPTTPTEGMAAPSDEEEVDDHITPEEMEGEGEGEEYEESEDFEDDGSGDPEAGESEEDEEVDEEEEEEEETNESVRVVRNALILESFDDFEARGPMPTRGNSHRDLYADELGSIELDFDEEGEDEEVDDCFVTCKSCGSKKGIERGSYPMGAANQADPNSWWQGAKMGMMCESCR